jgi:beta-galactosidase
MMIQKMYCPVVFMFFLSFLGMHPSIAQRRSLEPSVLTNSLGNSTMPVGAYYYPEHWPESQWDRDLSHMAKLGFEFTHFGEFAWAQMEPEEGQFDFSWLDKVVELAANKGLKVIMCTPTPTPPAWLTEKHPEILAVNQDLIRQGHGSRLHVIYDHPVYLEYTRQIVTRMARRYGNHPAVAGWQIDNEPHFGSISDYSDFAEKQFPVWLRNKYQTIENLNVAWGTAFWSQVYNHFDQVHLPNPNRAPQGANPHALLDYSRFMADRLASALKFQADLLRAHISPRQWVTTNYAYFKFLPMTDPFRNKTDMDFAAHTMYLTSGFLNDEGGPMAFRLGSGLELSFSAELAASVNGFTGIMELQPGQINWGVINPQPMPGAVRMWVWHTFALGDAFVCAYRFRQPLFGSEQTHKGIIDTDGVTLARGGGEYIQAMNEMRGLKIDVRVASESQADNARKTAVMWDLDNINDIENHRHHQDFDPWQYVYDYYAALKSMGSPVTFVQRGDEIDPKEYPFMVVPAFQLTDTELIGKWEAYVKKGGNLILTSRTAKKDMRGHLWEGRNQQPLYNLIGAAISEFDHLPAQFPGKVQYGEASYPWYRWGDWIEPYAGTTVLARYADQFYNETPAVVTRNLGEGSVTYIGVWSNNGGLEKAVLTNLYRQKGAEVYDLPSYVFTGWRNGYRVFVNYSSTVCELPMDTTDDIVIGSRELKPGGVTVVKGW